MATKTVTTTENTYDSLGRLTKQIVTVESADDPTWTFGDPPRRPGDWGGFPTYPLKVTSITNVKDATN